MAEKTLKTRLKLKYDTLVNWSKIGDTFVPLKGEVCFVEIADNADLIHNAPSILFKVGDGTSTFNALKWGSGLAADVYSWAKAATKPSYTYEEISGTPDIPVVGNGKITINQNGEEVGSFTVNQDSSTTIDLTDSGDTNTQYKLELTGNILKLQSKEKDSTEWSDVSGQTFTLPDNNTTYLFESSSVTSGAYFTVTPSDSATPQTVYISGLGSAAFKETESFATAAQGTKADNAMPKSGGTFTGNVILNGNPTENLGAATKQYVDSAIEGVSQFNYQVVESLPTASLDTMGTIYLVKHEHSTQDIYDEFITVIESGIDADNKFSWEKIGNTDLDLSGYVQTSRTINGLPLSSDITLTSTNVLTDDERSAIAEVTNISDSLSKKQDKNISITGLTADTVEGALSEIKDLSDTKQTEDQVNSLIQQELAKHAGIDKTGTISSIRMNGLNAAITSGEANLGDVVNKITGDTYISVTKDTSSSANFGNRILGLSEKVVTTDDTLILDCGSSTENI